MANTYQKNHLGWQLW